MAARAASQAADVLAVSLGRAEDRSRRRCELERAAETLDVGLRIINPPLAIGSADQLDLAEARLTHQLIDILAKIETPWLIAPSVHDWHHGHELVGRAVRSAVETAGRHGSVWWWRLWGQGGPTTTAVVLDDGEPVLRAALACHEGELVRNRYGELLSGQLAVGAVLGAEQLLGFGAPAWPWRRVATYCETIFCDERWTYAAPRVIEPGVPFGPGRPGAGDAGGWLHADSPSATLRSRR